MILIADQSISSAVVGGHEKRRSLSRSVTAHLDEFSAYLGAKDNGCGVDGYLAQGMAQAHWYAGSPTAGGGADSVRVNSSDTASVSKSEDVSDAAIVNFDRPAEAAADLEIAGSETICSSPLIDALQVLGSQFPHRQLNSAELRVVSGVGQHGDVANQERAHRAHAS